MSCVLSCPVTRRDRSPFALAADGETVKQANVTAGGIYPGDPPVERHDLT